MTTSRDSTNTAYDALLVLSFGGPEGPSDVRPFLERVTAGRGVPPDRLDDVAQHYLHFGGVSPINAHGRALVASVQGELARRGRTLPVYFGNRNWHPLIEDTVAQMTTDGVRNALVFPTSAWGGYSGCGQYHEDIARARAAVGEDAPTLTKLPQFSTHPKFIAAYVDAVRDACAALAESASAGSDPRLVFTAHSIPVAADRASGPPDAGGGLYSGQVHAAAAAIAAALAVADFDVVWQSRSGPPTVPWLEPDIEDHLEILSGNGISAVVTCPVGFVSDHMEVIWDLDNVASDRATELGLRYARAATPISDPRFTEMVVDLVEQHISGVDRGALGVGVNGTRCAPGCCASPGRPRP